MNMKHMLAAALALAAILCLTVCAGLAEEKEITESCTFSGKKAETNFKPLTDHSSKTAYKILKHGYVDITAPEYISRLVVEPKDMATCHITVHALIDGRLKCLYAEPCGTDAYAYTVPDGVTTLKLTNLASDKVMIAGLTVYGGGKEAMLKVKTDSSGCSYEITDIDAFTSYIESESRFLSNHELLLDQTAFEDERIAGYNQALDALKASHPSVSVYAYFCENTLSLEFADQIDPDSEFYKRLRSELHADGFSHLEITGAEQYMSYFYSTDHHWNYKGSYQAYLDILQLVMPEEYENRYIPTGTKEFPFIFNGSFSKDYGMLVSTETFTVYTFDDFPCYVSYVNGRKKTYSGYQKYMKGKYTQGGYVNHYSLFYGGDEAVIRLENKSCTTGRKLLIIGNSYANAVKTLLAKHFSTVVSVDLRHYKEDMKKDFSLSSCVDEFGITDVLFLSDAKLYGLYTGMDILP